MLQQSKTICSILVEDIMRNSSVKLLWVCTSGSGDVILRHFLSRALAVPLSSQAEPFVQSCTGQHEEQFFEITVDSR